MLRISANLLFFFFHIHLKKRKINRICYGEKLLGEVIPRRSIDQKGQNYFEKWHIFRGWKHGCKVCEECDHHSHLYCKRCKKVAEGIYKRCECPRVHSQFVVKKFV